MFILLGKYINALSLVLSLMIPGKFYFNTQLYQPFNSTIFPHMTQKQIYHLLAKAFPFHVIFISNAKDSSNFLYMQRDKEQILMHSFKLNNWKMRSTLR